LPVHRNENESAAPKFSPGLVKSDETLLRTIIDPDHLRPDGALDPAAISLQDIRERGWSVNRKKFTSLRRLRFLHSEKKARREAIKGFYVLPVGASYFRRPEPTTGTQEFVVIDDASWKNPAHASVLLASPCTEGKARQFRNLLLENLPKYVDVETVFNFGDNFGHAIGRVKQVVAYAKSRLRQFLRLRL
jgi:hypothetical protein